jgi:hypothetical protein
MATKETLPVQELIAVERIENNALILKNGGLRKILLVSGLNFDLKSEDEKNVIIFTYQNFLNSLDFSLQQFIHTRKININDYLSKLETKEYEETNDLIKNLIVEYKGFVQSLVAQNPIMSKAFFVVVPYDPISLAKTGRTMVNKVWGLFGKSAPPVPKPETEKPAFLQLDHRVDQVATGLSQIGLRVVPLNEKELEEFLYNLYNPETMERKRNP